jgi:hypothetical protein
LAAPHAGAARHAAFFSKTKAPLKKAALGQYTQKHAHTARVTLPLRKQRVQT